MKPTELSLSPFIGELGLPESPRWHAGELWLSDIIERRILRVDAKGSRHIVLKTDGEPSGLGWMPDGSLLVVQMEEHEVWRLHEGEFRRFSSTGHISRARLNDLVVHPRGDIWVSNSGFDYELEVPRTTSLVHINAKGHASIAARDLWRPNGMAINATGDTLVVAQSASPEVIEYRIDERGRLQDRRSFGMLEGARMSDGICMDAEEAVWIASPPTREFLRMQRGGRITHRISTGDRWAVACVLGGDDRRTLYAITAATLSRENARGTRLARVEIAEVEVPGAGVP